MMRVCECEMVAERLCISHNEAHHVSCPWHDGIARLSMCVTHIVTHTVDVQGSTVFFLTEQPAEKLK